MKKGIGIISCIIGILLAVIGVVMKVKGTMAASVIGGADGPTSVFVAGRGMEICLMLLLLQERLYWGLFCLCIGRKNLKSLKKRSGK